MKTRATKSGLTLYSIDEEDIINGVLTIPEGVTNIDCFVLRYIANLKWIEVDANNSAYSSLEGVLFNKDKTVLIRVPIGINMTSYTVPDGVTEIFEYALFYCTSLITVEIPNSVTCIDKSAFSSCKSLVNLILPESVKKIGIHAFANCLSLTDIIVPNSVTEIEAFAFSQCKSLKNVKLPCNITTISGRLFFNSYALSTITIPSSVTKIANDAFEGCGRLLINCCEDSIAVKYAKEHDIRYEVIS